MSVAVQAGVVSMAMQAAGKVGAGGTFTIGSETWHRLRVTLADFGPVQQIVPFPPEVDAELTINGAFKIGKFGGGSIAGLPRIAGTLGWLLKATLGAVTTVADQDVFAAAAVGADFHTFHFAANAYDTPWIAFRKLIPGANGGSDNDGQVIFDCKIDGMRMVIPNAGKVGVEWAFRGRDFQLVTNPSWTYAAAGEDGTSAPDVGQGHIKIGGTEYPFVGAEISFGNNLSAIEEEYIIGESSPDNFIVKGPRAAMIRLRYKYSQRNLFRLAFTGAIGGTAWSATPYQTDLNTTPTPDDPAFEAYFTAPSVIGVTAFPHAMAIRADRVVWDASSVRLVPGQIGVEEITGFVVTPTSGQKAFYIAIQNGLAAYT